MELSMELKVNFRWEVTVYWGVVEYAREISQYLYQWIVIWHKPRVNESMYERTVKYNHNSWRLVCSAFPNTAASGATIVTKQYDEK
jgi:hypothetical protein